ncbi:alpha/beta hydrolase [Hirschia maritima]|uniref:alpha/beta hydrolase n=1 Tax=Hirschia maritima TaxID=1121961 RepID=UPI00037CE9DA|nr:alpha/beta hydrolase [Hirschia maritima]
MLWPKLCLVCIMLGGVLVSGSCTISLPDDAIFQAPRWSNIAKSADQLRFVDEDKLTELNKFPGNRPLLEEHLPATIEHGFLNVSEFQIAYSLVRSGKFEDEQNRPLIVSCYGTGGDRPNYGVYYAEKLLPWGDVLQFDYPGYGDSSGETSISAIKTILPDVVRLANEQAGDRPLIYWGHSLGGFFCPEMANMSGKLDGVVYEATALSAEEASKVWKPWFLRIIPFLKLAPSETSREGNNATPLAGKEVPVLVLAGGKDKVLPAWLSRSLADALEDQGNDVTYHEFDNGTHMNLPFQEEFEGRVDPFFEKIQTNSNRKR